MNEREVKQILSPDSSFLVAAHELKSPLSIVRQLSLTLTDDKIKLSEKDQQKILNQVCTTSERALRLVNDLTKVARLEDAMFKLEPINAQKVCDDIVTEMEQSYLLSGQKIILKRKKIRYSSENLAVANYDLLRAILLNFGDNALYSSLKSSQVELSVKNVGQKVRVSVRDFGEELPLSIWRKIKKQKKVLSTSALRPQSSGLGIYICQNFAEAMDGKIGVIRHRNGNTFYVDLHRSEQLSLL